MIGVALLEEVGKAGMVAPAQNGPTVLNVGLVLGFIVTVKVVEVAH